MPTEAQVPGIVEAVRSKLVDAAKRDVRLQVASHRLDDDWLYVVVTPTQPGERASDHARLMSEIEKDLRGEGIDHLLLVPTLGE